MRPENAADFPLREARTIIRNLVRPKPWIYWTDFLISAAIGWSAFILAALSVPFSAIQVLSVIVATFALYRAVIFIHELSHLKRDTFRMFRLVWNLVCGFPMLVPSFTYAGVHIDHHRRKIYGTHGDGEYVPFANGPAWKLISYVFLSFLLPLLFIGRFLVLTPLSYIFPPLRGWLWERASSLTIDLDYRRPPPAKRDGTTWRIQEFMAFLSAATFTTLFVTGVLPLSFLAVWYVVVLLIFVFNSLRTLCAHAYRNPGDTPMTAAEEFLDSVNVPGNRFITSLWAPVGLRFHATHHLFPAIPYHALGEAHRKLIAELPDNSLYLAASRRSMADALTRIWQEAKMAEKQTRSNAASNPQPSSRTV